MNGLYSYLVHAVVQTPVTFIAGSHGCDVVDHPIDCAHLAWSKHDLACYSYTKCNLSNLNIITDQLKNFWYCKRDTIRGRQKQVMFSNKDLICENIQNI